MAGGDNGPINLLLGDVVMPGMGATAINHDAEAAAAEVEPGGPPGRSPGGAATWACRDWGQLPSPTPRRPPRRRARRGGGVSIIVDSSPCSLDFPNAAGGCFGEPDDVRHSEHASPGVHTAMMTFREYVLLREGLLLPDKPPRPGKPLLNVTPFQNRRRTRTFKPRMARVARSPSVKKALVKRGPVAPLA